MHIDLKYLSILTGFLALGCAPADEDKDGRPEVDDHGAGDTLNPMDEDGSDSDEEEDEPDEEDPDEDAGADPVEGDSANVVSDTLPGAMACSAVGSARVVMRNTGTTVWTREDGYKLGMVDDEDPFYGPDTRVWLPEDIEVPPGDSWSFTIDMTAPSTSGSYTTDWQMVREGVAWFGEQVGADVNVACGDPGTGGGAWTEEGCARNGSEICDDEVFGVEAGQRYGLKCAGPEGGIGFISSNTGPVMSDGMERCQGWEERGEDAWDSLDYVHSFVCSTERIIEVDLSAWEGGYLWFGAHDHPDGGGHMTNICLVSQPD